MTLGIAIATVVGALAVIFVLRRIRARRRFGACHGRIGRRAHMLRRLFRRLDTTPGQERTILEAVTLVGNAVAGSRDTFASSRDELARAVGGDYFDESALFAAYAKHDQALAGIRGEIGEALARVHDVLTVEQRGKLAEMLAKGFRGPFGWRSSPPGAAV